jgi:hypothetical protein
MPFNGQPSWIKQLTPGRIFCYVWHSNSYHWSVTTNITEQHQSCPFAISFIATERKDGKLLLNKTMSWYSLTHKPHRYKLFKDCMLQIRSLRLCTSNSSVYKLDQVSVSSHQVYPPPHISIWWEWLWTSPWLSRGMYWAMMARISESMYLCTHGQCKNRISCQPRVIRR